MANVKDFNPKAVLVVRKKQGLKIGGRLYEKGEPVSDDCITLRKKLQLFKQGFLCYPHDLQIAKEAPSKELPEGEQMSEDGVRTNDEARADAEADASRKVIEDAEAAKAAEADAKAKEEDDAAEAAAADANSDDKSGEADSKESAAPVADAEKKAEKSEVKADAPVVVKKKRARKKKS